MRSCESEDPEQVADEHAVRVVGGGCHIPDTCLSSLKPRENYDAAWSKIHLREFHFYDFSSFHDSGTDTYIHKKTGIVQPSSHIDSEQVHQSRDSEPQLVMHTILIARNIVQTCQPSR